MKFVHYTSNGLLDIYSPSKLLYLFLAKKYLVSVFGSQWYESGQVAQILIIWLLIGFAKTPSTMTYSIFNLQKVQLVGESLLLIF
ncbi:MAG: hypothetical protein CM15mP33_00010 [Candidatus Neomarinimicrobiota bacterium]|nr:MAG: hypothetical protein CM15mP33_00010 [Candidatus Neomarinimicrobiota bacterium]